MSKLIENFKTFQSMIIRLNALQNAFKRKDNVISGVARILFRGGVGTLRPLKGYHTFGAGGPGGEGPPPEDSEVSFFQTMQSIRKGIGVSKIASIFLPKNLFFLRKKFEKSNRFDRNL